jgi:hypothetical protein
MLRYDRMLKARGIEISLSELNILAERIWMNKVIKPEYPYLNLVSIWRMNKDEWTEFTDTKQTRRLMRGYMFRITFCNCSRGDIKPKLP